MNTYHKPVLKKEVINYLDIKDKGIYVDATIGGGGHLKAICDSQKDIEVIAIDNDLDAINYVKNCLAEYKDKIIFSNKNFSYLTSILALNKIDKIDGILYDLGLSSHQLEAKGRGFSYKINEKLDMRFNQNSKLSAYKVINYYLQVDLERIIREYGEERYWKKISRAIVKNRKKKSIDTTFDLKNIIKENVPKKNCAKSLARVFQAIRIEVNKELESLKKALADTVEVLKKGARILVISYHSLEDRIVKEFFRYENLSCICPPKFPECICDKEKRLKIITKHPITPETKEINLNPRSRSAKLRIAERC